MDTVVIGTEMPFFLVFFDQDMDTVVQMWEKWVSTKQLVRARHENPAMHSMVILQPALVTTVQFVPNEPGRRLFGTQTLYTLPTLLARTGADDGPPELCHYWSLSGRGFSARLDPQPDGTTGLILDNWEFGRI